MSNLSSDATGNREIIKQGRANPVLFVSSPNKRQGSTDQFPFNFHSPQFFLVESAVQSSVPPNRTVDLQKEQDSVSAVHKARRYRKLDPWVPLSKKTKHLFTTTHSNIIQIPSPIFQLGNFVRSQKILNPACTGPGLFHTRSCLENRPLQPAIRRSFFPSLPLT